MERAPVPGSLPPRPRTPQPLVQRLSAIAALDKKQIVNDSDGPTSAAASERVSCEQLGTVIHYTAPAGSERHLCTAVVRVRVHVCACVCVCTYSPWHNKAVISSSASAANQRATSGNRLSRWCCK